MIAKSAIQGGANVYKCWERKKNREDYALFVILGGCQILPKNLDEMVSFLIRKLFFGRSTSGAVRCIGMLTTSVVEILLQQLQRQNGLQWSPWQSFWVPAAWLIIRLLSIGWAFISLQGIIDNAMIVIHNINAANFIWTKVMDLGVSLLFYKLFLIICDGY